MLLVPRDDELAKFKFLFLIFDFCYENDNVGLLLSFTYSYEQMLRISDSGAND